jgi:hypothetical protein
MTKGKENSFDTVFVTMDYFDSPTAYGDVAISYLLGSVGGEWSPYMHSNGVSGNPSAYF